MRSDLPRSRAERRDVAINLVETRTTRSPRLIRNRSSAPETCRQSSSAHTRSPASPRAHTTSAQNPRAPTATVFSPISCPVAASTATIECELLCMSAPSTIINPSPFTSTESGHPADTACSGRCHAPIKSRRASPTGDERHNKSKSGHPGRQPQRESARRPVGTLPSTSDVTDGPNRNSKPRSSRRTREPPPRRCRSEAAAAAAEPQAGGSPVYPRRGAGDAMAIESHARVARRLSRVSAHEPARRRSRSRAAHRGRMAAGNRGRSAR